MKKIFIVIFLLLMLNGCFYKNVRVDRELCVVTKYDPTPICKSINSDDKNENKPLFRYKITYYTIDGEYSVELGSKWRFSLGNRINKN